MAAFLADHEECGKGFDIQRRQGSDGSVVRVVCGGCGEAIEYPAVADAELQAEEPASRSVSGRLLNRDRPSRGAAPTALLDSGWNEPAPAAGSSQRAGVDGRRGRPGSPVGWPRWLSVTLIALLIGGGLLLIALGVASDGDPSDNGPGGTGEPASSVALSNPPPSVELSTPTPPVKLVRREFAERVSIGIPDGWNAGVLGAAVTISSRNGRSTIQVYFEQGAKPDDELARGARGFLLQRHAGARVTASGRVDAGGHQARSVRVVYPDGTESAVVLVAGGYSYLVLERLSKPFSPALQRSADAVVESFRPI